MKSTYTMGVSPMNPRFYMLTKSIPAHINIDLCATEFALARQQRSEHVVLVSQ